MTGNRNRTSCSDSSSDTACKDPSSLRNLVVSASPETTKAVSKHHQKKFILKEKMNEAYLKVGTVK